MTGNDDEKRPPLLTDDDFAALMQAEYDKQKPVQATPAREQVWRRMQPSLIKTHVLSRRLPWMAAAAVVCLALLLPWLMPHAPETRLKGNGEDGIAVTLQAYVLGEQGRLSAASGVLPSGTTVVFKTRSTQRGAAALLLSRNSQPMEVRFTGGLDPGDAVLLQKNTNAYGYMIEPKDKSLRFCLLTAADTALLQKRLQQWPSLQLTLPPAACVDITAQDGAKP